MKDNMKILKCSNRTEYFLNGKRHREDGPAIEYADGGKEWWINGELHREDGPACEYTDGDEEYWYNGCRIDEFDDKRIEIDANLSEIDIIKYLLMIQVLQ